MEAPPFQMAHPQQAVCVRKACKYYGTKKNPIPVLDGMNMTVSKGSIYGLLGASGCGKTTLLNCIIGRKKLDSGDIWVLGDRPGAKGSGIPGPRIGYMPQEIALNGDFTIRESLKYFGWISGMTAEQIESRLEFLVNFLLLPDANNFVNTLSGGQKRRVSLAIALLHQPELLILDEPTVGVDPLLRHTIWEHLIEIANNDKTTIIITTHYIDEAKLAHSVALMRGGYFLAEEHPQDLIEKLGCENLEEAFLRLSVYQNKGKSRRGSISQEISETAQNPSGSVNNAAVFDDEDSDCRGEFGDHVTFSNTEKSLRVPELMEIEPVREKPSTFLDSFRLLNSTNVYALMWKNFLWMSRNLLILTFILGLPVVQTVLFFLSIGHDPVGLPIAVVNYEVQDSRVCTFDLACNSTRLSCNYLEYVKKNSLELRFYPSAEEGKNSVFRGETWATVIFHSNFSESLKLRIIGEGEISAADLITSSVEVYQDNSNQNLATYIKRDLFFAFESFLQDYMRSCNYNPKAAIIPLKWEKPVYGSSVVDFADFAAPGIILTLVFFLALTLTAGAVMVERAEGILERSLANGVTNVEIMFSHLISESVIMLGQCASVLIVTFLIFGIKQQGNILWVILLEILTGFCGMCFGVTIACLCPDERSASYVGLGSFLPVINLCGIIWPIEGMDNTLQFFASLLPITHSTTSLRYIISRGWGITNPQVYDGFLVTVLWIFIFLIISVVVLKLKKN